LFSILSDGEAKDGDTTSEIPTTDVPTTETAPTVDTPVIQKPPTPVMQEVDSTHPEVIALVEVAIKEADKQIIALPPDVYIEIMEGAIKDVEKNMREQRPNGPL